MYVKSGQSNITEDAFCMPCDLEMCNEMCNEFAGGLFFWGVTNTSRESTMYPKAVQDLCGWKIRSLACG